jgi:hypothetical protein
MTEGTLDGLKAMRIGVLFALFSLLYGFGLGGVFGAAEDQLKAHLEQEGRAVFETVYASDQAKLDGILSKSWVYFQRAHLHANGLGTAALAMILLLACSGAVGRLERLTAALLGIGALGYASYWMFAGLQAPGLGSTGAAKEALGWLAIPTSGACMVGLVLVLFRFVRAAFATPAVSYQPSRSPPSNQSQSR